LKVISWQPNILKRTIKSICFCCSDKTSTWYFERAPEPSDIMWQNLGVSAFSRVFRFGLTYITILGLIGVGILGICFLKYFQKEFTKKY
jgi:hypothetical protein